MSAEAARQALADKVRAGAHFYMAHRLTESPHETDPEITMGTHVRENCPGCKAEEALDALAALGEQASPDAALIEALEAFLDLNYGYLDYKVKDALEPVLAALAAARAGETP